MLSEIPFAVLICGISLTGLWISNLLYDQKVSQYISRKVGHSAGGMSILLMFFMFRSAWWPLILSGAFCLLISAARLLRPATFRGVGGTGRAAGTLSEIWFTLIAVLCYLIGWLWLDKPAMVVTSLLYMAWGDCITGLVRTKVYHKPVKGLWGSLAMLLVCLLVSWAFIKPFWIGAAASVIATLAEWACGDVGVIKIADDNWAIPSAGMGTMLLLSFLTGIPVN